MIFPNDKVLIVAAGHVGNTLFCTPAIHLLKKHKPHLQIDVVVLHPRAADALKNNPDIHHIYSKRFKRSIRRLVNRYPLAIFLNRISFEFCYTEAPKNVITVDHSDPTKHRAGEVLEFMSQLLACEVEADDRHYILQPLQNDLIKTKALFSQFNKETLVGIHLGGGRTQIHGWKFWYKKRTHDPRLWPLDNYIDVAERLKAANPNIRFVITGGSNEHFLGKAFMKKMPCTLNFIGKTTISQLTSLMEYLKLFITHDTGVFHVAVATKTPLIGLFGRTDPLRSGPYPREMHHNILTGKDMLAITPEEVSQAALTMCNDERLT